MSVSLVEMCRQWAKENPIPKDIQKLTVEEIKEKIERLNKIDMKCFGSTRHFRAFVVLIYPENTEYPFAKEVLTNKTRSDSLRHWFPVFELNLGEP